MKRLVFLLPLLLTTSAFAQSAPATPAAAAPAAAAPATVNFTDVADMPGLTDPSQKNTFTVGISDAQIDMHLTITCSAGGSSLLVFHKDKVCGLAGNGSVINPTNKQAYPRTQYQGGYDVTAAGSAEGSEMSANYLQLGSAPAGSTPFGGRLKLKAQLSASGMDAVEQSVYDKLQLGSAAANGTIDKRLDSVGFDGFFVPGAGWPDDKGCTWDGKMVFAYQTNSWFIELMGDCGGQKYDLKGNMPWTEVKGQSNQMNYTLNLALPTTASVGDAALFNTVDMFAQVPGVQATILQKNSDIVTVKVDNQDTDTPAHVEASGTITGTGVPLPVVRSLAVILGLLSDNLFGA